MDIHMINIKNTDNEMIMCIEEQQICEYQRW